MYHLWDLDIRSQCVTQAKDTNVTWEHVGRHLLRPKPGPPTETGGGAHDLCLNQPQGRGVGDYDLV